MSDEDEFAPNCKYANVPLNINIKQYTMYVCFQVWKLSLITSLTTNTTTPSPHPHPHHTHSKTNKNIKYNECLSRRYSVTPNCQYASVHPNIDTIYIDAYMSCACIYVCIFNFMHMYTNSLNAFIRYSLISELHKKLKNSFCLYTFKANIMLCDL